MPTPKIPAAHGFVSTLAVDALSRGEPSADGKGPDRKPYRDSDVSDLSPPDRLDWLLQQYRDLLVALSSEVNAPHYEIAEDSRSRIKAEIFQTQRREMKTLRQVYYPGSWSLASSRTMQMQDPTTADVHEDQVSAPVPHVSTQEPNRRWCTSQSEANKLSSAMSIDFIAPSSNQVNETQPAFQARPLPAARHRMSSAAQFQPAPQPQTPDAQSLAPENNDLRPWYDLRPRSYSRQSIASPPFPRLVRHSRTGPPAQLSSLESEESTLPKYSRTPESRLELHAAPLQFDFAPRRQRGRDDYRNHDDNDQIANLLSRGNGDLSRTLDSEAPTSTFSDYEQPSSRPTFSQSLIPHSESLQGSPVPQRRDDSSKPRSSKRLRSSKVEDYAEVTMDDEESPGSQTSASEVIGFNNFRSVSGTESRTKHNVRRIRAKGSRTRLRRQSRLEDANSENLAEHVVDELLATWTTLAC